MRIPRSTLEQWVVLACVVDQGGFAQAGEFLHRSQSAISYAIGRLQEQLGVRLLNIQGRKAQLTEQGEALLRQARMLIEQAASLEQMAQSLDQGVEAELKLVVDAAYPTSSLLEALGIFSREMAHCRVQLREVVLSGAEEALLDGSADLVIGTRVPPGVLGDQLLVVDFVAVASPDHPLHRLQRELDAADLAGALQVVIKDSGERQPRDEGWLGASERWTVTSMATALAVVRQGLGFAWLPSHLAGPDLLAGSLLPLPLALGQHRLVPLYLMFRDPALAGPGARRLAALLKLARVAQGRVADRQNLSDTILTG